MINIINKEDCCGCGACVQKCPKRCISFQEDNEGFLYPIVDEGNCIDCGLCESVCPILNPYSMRTPLHTYAAINTNENIRRQSSSGGIFTILAEKILDEGGIVFGARFDENWQVFIDYTETQEGLAAFRGSKYVQARTGETFRQCEEFLKEGRKVLYSGTPCQISALKHFLRKEYDKLLTVDVACHGVPSPKVWDRYLSELKAPENIRKICMREKNSGWKNFSFKVDYDEENYILSFSSAAHKNAYMEAFLCDLILRPSCHSCVAKGCSSQSDITIADYWGIWNINPDFFDDKGTSLVLIHNNKAVDLISHQRVYLCESSFDEAVRYNSALVKSSTPHRNREAFWVELEGEKSLEKIVSKFTSPKGITAVKDTVKKILKNVMGGGKINVVSHPSRISKLEIYGIYFREKRRSWKNYEVIIELKVVGNN